MYLPAVHVVLVNQGSKLKSQVVRAPDVEANWPGTPPSPKTSSHMIDDAEKGHKLTVPA